MSIQMKNLVKLRKKANLNQAQLAKMLDVTKITILRWEKGEREPNSSYLLKMAEIFNVSLDFLLDRIALLKQPDGILDYKFCTENDILTGTLMYHFGIIQNDNTLKSFIVIEEETGTLINKIIQSSGPYEYLTLVCILNHKLDFYCDPFKNNIDIIIRAFGKYQKLIINDMMSTRLDYVKYEKHLNEWLKLSSAEKIEQMNSIKNVP